jgi:hypothetical protein
MIWGRVCIYTYCFQEQIAIYEYPSPKRANARSVDTPENIKAFLGRVESVIKEGLVTLEKAGVQIYRGSQRNE